MLAETNVPGEERTSCRDCGSRARVVRRSTSDRLTIRDRLSRILGIDARGRVFHKQTIRDSRSHDRTIVEWGQVFDHRGDKYVEDLAFADGRRVHVEERLSEHTGHGPDKPELRAEREIAKAKRQAERTERKALRDKQYRERTRGQPE